MCLMHALKDALVSAGIAMLARFHMPEHCMRKPGRDIVSRVLHTDGCVPAHRFLSPRGVLWRFLTARSRKGRFLPEGSKMEAHQ